MMSRKLLEEIYSYESLYDLDRDINYATDEVYGPIMKDLPRDEHGYIEGTFKVTIEWSNNE